MTQGIEDLSNRELPPIVKEKRIPVVEVFGPTIEGEGKIVGMQTMFIRFGLCDYRCTKCDSMHAVDPRLVKAGAEWLTEDEIADKLLTFMEERYVTHIENVVFSGGNPCIHDLTHLVHRLQAAGKRIHVETQGTKTPRWLNLVYHICVSPKSPGMGEKFDPEVFMHFMREFQDRRVSVKVVIFDNRDIEFAAGVAGLLQDAHLPNFKMHSDFYLSLGNDQPPVFELGMNPATGENQVGQLITDKNDQGILENDNKNPLVVNLLNRYNILCEDVMKDHRLAFARFLPQLHVLVWGNETGR